jgi:D-alanine-D-alanine ligase
METHVDVIIFFGGTSGERRVSVASAQNLASLLPDAHAWFVTPDGVVQKTSRTKLLGFERPFESDFSEDGERIGDIAEALTKTAGATLLLALHGGQGEDGTLQALLEQRRIPFTGSGSEASRRAFDKVVAKNIVRTKNVKTADSVVLAQHSREAAAAALGDLLKKHGRVVVKPVADGSSVGLHHVRSEADADEVADIIASQPATAYLAEAFLKGREMTCGVIEMDGALRALPPSEVIIEEGRAFDFEGKYLGKGTREITPADAPREMIEAVQALAVSAHTALGCRGYTRTDVIVTERGAYFLETNTLPGMTRASFFPQQLQAARIPLETFVKSQLALARNRYL